ncbi:hypothetical protein [Pedobacter sp. GR22-6]|uniref:hypothetical protein n=1 Tax=Pedobacter sp. GR22-6 TaxID=3127957 RepID=UPI00307F0BEF
MLKAFTWPDFLLASILLSLIWYALVWLLYFRKKKVPNKDALPHRWQQQVDDLAEEDDLMGTSVLDHGVSVVEADEFSFSPESDEGGVPDRLDQIGLIADAQQEIRSICRLLETQDGDKEDFQALFGVLRTKYPELKTSPQLAAFNQFIREQVPFQLTEEELEDLWI